MNELRFTGFLMLITFWTGICEFTHPASSVVIKNTPSLKTQAEELSFRSVSRSDYTIEANRSDNEYKTLFSDFVMYTREIEGPTAYQSYNNTIKVEEGPGPMLSLPENHFCRFLHNRAFFCKYQT
jgi:hypothetical protein